MKRGVVAIVPAAGCGRRLGSKVPKPFVPLAGRPLIVHTLKAIEGCAAVDAIVIAAQRPFIKRCRDLAAAYGIRKLIDVVAGGKTRYESVKNGLASLRRPFEIVLIHDGARPLVDSKTIAASVRLARRYGACVAAVPESDTVKFAGPDLVVRKTLDRSRVFRAQTPQAFRYNVIAKAYAPPRRAATDDAALVEAAGGRVRILPGSYRNIKITTKEDLRIAEVLL